MSLSDKQHQFCLCAHKLEQFWIDKGWKFVLAEAYRPPELAEIYAERGVGIKNSVHTLKLARDYYLFDGHRVLWDGPRYQESGDYWTSLHPLARWGGNFRNRGRGPGRDVYHFSFIHNGVQ